jgi:hypothetical protein
MTGLSNQALLGPGCKFLDALLDALPIFTIEALGVSLRTRGECSSGKLTAVRVTVAGASVSSQMTKRALCENNVAKGKGIVEKGGVVRQRRGLHARVQRQWRGSKAMSLDS